jgi:D-amino-acid dehydrogenase
VVRGDGTRIAFEPADVIYVNAGATRPADAWLDRLKEGGRLILPLTADAFPNRDARRGAVFRRRPCLPDMVPVIGRGERHRGLWFAFGHAHHGFTLGPVTGRLLAEMMTGETPFTLNPALGGCAEWPNRRIRPVWEQI